MSEIQLVSKPEGVSITLDEVEFLLGKAEVLSIAVFLADVIEQRQQGRDVERALVMHPKEDE